MTRSVRHVAGVMLVLFVALLVNLNIIQLLRADELANDPLNRRVIIREYRIERGPIVVAGDEVAYSVETDGDLTYQRVYARPDRYAHLVGYYSPELSRSGIEQALNEQLTGQPTEVIAQNLADLLSGRDPEGNTVVLTIDPQVQEAAAAGLGDRVGAVVALDATTGAVLAHFSNPGFDPNLLSSHDRNQISAHAQELNADPRQPFVDRVRSEHFPPGSGFKIVTAATALERGVPVSTQFPDPVEFDVPQTSADISNFGGGTCANGTSITLADAFRVSCNTTFADLGVQLGPDALIAQAERLGFNRTVPYELPVTASVIPKEMDLPATAQSAIGQRDVRWTPMNAALVAAAVVNDGLLMRPYVVEEVLDPSSRRIEGAAGQGPWADDGFDAQALTPQTASVLEDLMVSVVTNGTGTNAQIEGLRVGGKTGTAQVERGRSPTVWFIGFVDDEASGRRVAVAVVLPEAGDDATGGVVAAPIARGVMEAAVRPR